MIENLRTARRLVGAERKIFAVVKANGYGFGSLEMAEILVGPRVARVYLEGEEAVKVVAPT